MASGPPPSKRPRLSMACNECRRRKVKCDAEYPKCRNCAQRGGDCATSDPKRPGIPVLREWILDDKTGSAAPEDRDASRLPPAGPVAESLKATSPASVSKAASRMDSASVHGEVNEVSPVYHPYQMSFHAVHGTNRIKMQGASSSACLMKSLDLYLAAVNIRPISPSFRYGMEFAEEMSLPLAISLPSFPDLERRQEYVSAYFQRIHTLWPIFDVDATKSATHWLASIPNLKSLSRDHVPLLMSAYLVMSLGSDELAQCRTDDGDKYLDAASTLVGSVLQLPYLPAVQALMLLAIAYRGRNKDGVAWQITGMAVRIAQSLGLHKHSAIKPSIEHAVTHRSDQLFHARIWAVCCCLEKILELESGRPSAISFVDSDQMMAELQRAPGHDFLQWNMNLAAFQGQISQQIYTHKQRELTAETILQYTARVDQALQAWADRIPPEFKPGNELFCSQEDFHMAAFLSIQFHQTMIALHRAALIAPEGTFDEEVDKHCSDSPSQVRLKRGELICVNGARSIIRLYLEVSEQKSESRVSGAGPALLACIALAIFLIKHPGGRAHAADLELLKAGVDYTSDRYLAAGQDARVAQGTSSIYDKVRLRCRQYDQQRQRPTLNRGSSRAALNTVHQRNSASSGAATPASAGPQLDQDQSRNMPSSRDRYGLSSQNILDPDSMNRGPAGPSVGAALPVSGNLWTTPQSQGQGSGQQYLFDYPNDLLINQEMAPETEALPFMNFNVEEMWEWMVGMDSTDMAHPAYLPNNNLPM